MTPVSASVKPFQEGVGLAPLRVMPKVDLFSCFQEAPIQSLSWAAARLSYRLCSQQNYYI